MSREVTCTDVCVHVKHRELVRRNNHPHPADSRMKPFRRFRGGVEGSGRVGLGRCALVDYSSVSYRVKFRSHYLPDVYSED